jgi:nicotinamide-nucleotide amidase
VRVEVINTGSELLLGHVVNSHLGYFSQQLMPLGLTIARQCTVPDGPELKEVFREVLDRADLVFITGGLGPTSDDLTRDILADLLDMPLDHHPEIAEKNSAYFASRKLEPPPIVRVQALVPRGAEVLPNDQGTAPGLLIRKKGKAVFCLPGPPRELYPMMEESVLPRLRTLLPSASAILERTFRTLGLGESFVQDRLEARLREIGGVRLEIGYCARPGEVDLRLVTGAPEILEAASRYVRDELGSAVYAEGQEILEGLVVQAATAKGVWLATAESCTGGLVAHRITNVPGASACLDRGWVTYSNEAKIAELGVAEETLSAHGAVSEATAREMALGALERSRASVAVSLTGIAGPGGGTPEKPVGLVWIGLASKVGSAPKISAQKFHLSLDRVTFKTMAAQRALFACLQALRQ